jgi:hypothetical protein
MKNITTTDFYFLLTLNKNNLIYLIIYFLFTKTDVENNGGIFEAS